MFKPSGRLALSVLICFVMSSFLSNLTIFPVKANTFTQTETSGENSLAFSEDVYSSQNTSVSDDVYATPEPETFEVFKFPVDSRISDAISHPTEPVIFAADSVNSIVYSVNVETGTVRDVYVGGTIERMAYFDDELFVTVLTGPRSIYLSREEQSGVIAVIDTKNMELKEKIEIDIDPFDIVAGRDGYLYVPSGSGQSAAGQWTSFDSYSRSTKELKDSKILRSKYLAEYHPTLNRIYVMDIGLLTHYYRAYDIENGVFVSSYDSIYCGDYLLEMKFKISPDGKYIFNQTGCIFTCSEDKNQDMRFFFKLDKSFNDIAFDLDHNLFFITAENNQIYAYDYDALCSIDSINLEGNVLKLFYLDGKLIALSDYGKGELALENLQIGNIINNLPMPTPTPIATTIPTVPNEPLTRIDLNMEVKDSVIHPDKEFIYMINSSDELVKVNFETGDMITISLSYSPNSIAFGNGEIYVGFGSHGMIGIYDADTLQYKDKIMVRDTFFDVAVGHDEYIYTSPKENKNETRYVKSFSRETKQEVSKRGLNRLGYFEINPVNNSFVLSSMQVRPTDLYTIKYDNGVLTEHYESTYHGEYTIGSKNRITPDGKYIFNNSGSIFTASDDKTADLKFYFKLDKSFNDVVFDIEKDKFYIAADKNTIYGYNFSTLTVSDTKHTEGKVLDMYFRDGYIIAVSRAKDNMMIIEKIQIGKDPSPTEDATPTPTSTPTLTPDPTQNPIKSIDLRSYTIKDPVIHDKSPIVYFIDDTDNKLISVNCKTGEIKESNVRYSPTCLDVYNGEVYVGCGKNGIIYIYDDDTLTFKEQIMSGEIFNHMRIGNDGFIYLLDENCVRSLSRTSKQEISTMYVFFLGKMEKHPTRNVFYFTREGITPENIHAIEYDSGIAINSHESPYFNDYKIGDINRISPDGKLLFNSSGNIFNTGINPMYDIRYVSKLENGFSDACFDEKNNLLFAANSNIIDIYDYNTLTKLASMDIGNKPSYVFYKDGILISLAANSLEIIASEELSEIIPSTPTPTPAPGIMLPFNATISDAVAHPEKPVIFAADAANSKIYSVNIETGVIKETFIGGAIERLYYQNDTLYVTISVGVHNSYWWEEAQSGAIVIIDADTMEIEDRFEIDTDPYDIVAGRDGIIYVSSASGQFTSINSYSPDAKQMIDTGYIRQKSFMELHPTLNRIYAIITETNIRDYIAINIDNGEFVSSNKSLYYGYYPLAANFKISPDGNYLFNGCGAIFKCSEDASKDMKFAFELDKVFSDIAFNMEENKFYTTTGDNQIYVYNYEDFSVIDTMSSIGEILKLVYVNGKLCALSKNHNGMPMFEVIKQPKIIYGDVNQDREVNSTDLTYLKKYILKKGVYELDDYSYLAADVDGDGNVDSLDLTYIKRYILRKISEFPASRK